MSKERRAPTATLTQDEILSFFDIDAKNGRLFWRRMPGNTRSDRLGKEAGSLLTSRGKLYWFVRIGSRTYGRGHLIYTAIHGTWPRPCLDHISGDSTDDRPENLRPASRLENSQNRKPSRSRKLPMGVRLVAKSGRYQARITNNNKQIHLGAYDTPEEARAIYVAKRKELFGDFA